MSQRDLVGADRLILIAAFRYALGRMTYIVDDVASFIERNAEALSPDDRRLIVREIDDQRAIGSLGMKCDERRWMRVRERMERRTADPSSMRAAGENELRQRDFMRRGMDAYREREGGMPGVRCGLGDAAHLADAIGRDILAEHAGYRGKPSKLSKLLAAAAARIGDAIWAARQETYGAETTGSADA